MAAPFTFVDSKAERAIKAYLISKGAGSLLDIFTAMEIATRTFPNTTITAVRGVPDPKFTGNYRIQFWIKHKGQATQAANEPNKTLPITQFINRIETTGDALMQSDDGQTFSQTARDITAAGRALAVATNPADPDSAKQALDNADMLDFTLWDWQDEGFGQGDAEEEGCSWVRIQMFSALCCNSNVD